ncbi:glycosyltransferase family 2 protein [Microbulbifer agarilyticus]|uniref:glycosyltransferase family 2 protein n=1 Tax=Microbulbifer agarilyticus TaxID=260552 RepID=UPI001CD31AC9|nr:glycosyltransferase family 2 protein [Microbulbifer agarilyticus]MCA0894463.1 glycosyltransferase family 2 protein [Microbulbifer agarilyticus]
MSNKTRLNIVIVCYNCGADIVRLFADIDDGDLPLPAIEFFVVDNASMDDSLSILRPLSPKIHLIESDENIGFAAGCNLGAAAIDNSAPILFLNPDVRLQHDSLSNLLAFAAATPGAGIWGGVTCDEQGEYDGKSAWREPSLIDLLSWSLGGDFLLRRTFGRTSGGYSPRALCKGTSVDAVSGCFLLIDQALFRLLNGFDEGFFLYSEEIDLCRRARALGAQPRVTGNAVVLHAGSKTLSGINKLNHLYRSKLQYFAKHGSSVTVVVARVLIALGSAIRFAAFSALVQIGKGSREQQSVWKQFLDDQWQWHKARSDA